MKVMTGGWCYQLKCMMSKLTSGVVSITHTTIQGNKKGFFSNLIDQLVSCIIGANNEKRNSGEPS